MAKSEKHTECAAASTVAPGTIVSIDHVPKERLQFRALVVGNPNYFGNLAISPFPPVVAIKGNTTYEEIKCVGFHPQSNRLDAVVFLKQSFGYSGDVCSAGSTEYVRFYLSFDNGATWVDQGVTSFTAYDVPAGVTGGRRLEYAAGVASVPPRRWCTIPNIILARAILSWHDVPPANTPNHIPVWGNVHDTHIQVDPVWFLKWIDLFKLADLKLAPAIAESLDLDQTVSAAPKKALTVAELQGLYKNKGVEPHRYAMAEIKKLIKTPEATAGLPHPFYTLSPAQLGFSLSDVIGKLLATDGSTVYEELDCIGLKPNGLANELVGVLRIKRSSGFSGGPCTKGSREYVTFWGDFNNNGTFETCLGTASVQVFDLDVPADGLEYSINLPVNLNPYRRPCGEGPRVVPIRAILSWNEVPDCGNPNWVPTWGNREETLILIPPGVPIVPGDFSPFLYDISGAAVCAIDQGTGLAAVDRPFGGTLCITGEIPGALDLDVPDTLEYKVWATQGAVNASTHIAVYDYRGRGHGPRDSDQLHHRANGDGRVLHVPRTWNAGARCMAACFQPESSVGRLEYVGAHRHLDDSYPGARRRYRGTHLCRGHHDMPRGRHYANQCQRDVGRGGAGSQHFDRWIHRCHGIPRGTSVWRLHYRCHDQRDLRYHGQYRRRLLFLYARAESVRSRSAPACEFRRRRGVDPDASVRNLECCHRWTSGIRTVWLRGQTGCLRSDDRRLRNLLARFRLGRILPAKSRLTARPRERGSRQSLVLVRARRVGGVARYPLPSRRARPVGCVDPLSRTGCSVRPWRLVRMLLLLEFVDRCACSVVARYDVAGAIGRMARVVGGSDPHRGARNRESSRFIRRGGSAR